MISLIDAIVSIKSDAQVSVEITGDEADEVLYVEGDDIPDAVLYVDDDEIPEGKEVGDVKIEAKKVGDVKIPAIEPNITWHPVLYVEGDDLPDQVLYVESDDIPEGKNIGDVKTKAKKVGDVKIEANPTNITLDQIRAEQAVLQSSYDALNYARSRAESYPALSEFVEAYTEKEIGGDSTKWDAYVIAYNAVRSANPKT